VKEVSPEVACNRIVSEFERRGWDRELTVASDLVRCVARQGGVPADVDKLAKAVPSFFLAVNRTERADVRDALQRALAGYRIVEDSPRISATHVYGDNTQVFVGRNRVTNEKKIQINNFGQFAGNIDSSNSEVQVDRQQQVVLADQERLLREAIDDPDVQEVLAQSLPLEEKSRALGKKLARMTGYAVDVTTDFAAKFLAEMIRPR
jgi:hypothetical protein